MPGGKKVQPGGKEAPGAKEEGEAEQGKVAHLWHTLAHTFVFSTGRRVSVE